MEGFTISIDTIWVLIAAAFVMFMQPGFALVESGFSRSKNTANILMKNLMDFSIGSLAFFFIGFHIMFAGEEPLYILLTSGFFEFCEDFHAAALLSCSRLTSCARRRALTICRPLALRR